MELPLQIVRHGVELSPAEEEAIREAAGKLESFWDQIISCRVLVDMPQRRGRTGRRYNVRIDLRVPGGELVIKRQPREQLLDAVQDAFQAAGRRVQDRVRRVREGVPLDRGSPRGRVTRLLRWEGYGFITTEDNREIYFDRRSVLDGGFDRLEEGSEVHFAEEAGEQGPQASTVVVGSRPRPLGGEKP
jgi:cold shock CspA family protein/ribosome-associated translation inhibitor RaiA